MDYNLKRNDQFNLKKKKKRTKSDILKQLWDLKKRKANWELIQAKEIDDLKSEALSLNTWWRSNNFNLDKANETGNKLAENAGKIADATASNAIEFWEKTSEKVQERDQPKLDRVNEKEKNVKNVIDKFEDISDWQRREEITNITNRQKQIAWRQANIAAAKAWSNGVVLSESAKMSIKDDIIAKYWQNILTAEQYELENQRSIDDDLKNIWLKEFEIQWNIDAFKDSIQDNAYAPILNALDDAKKGNQKAIDDVSSFFQEIVRKKWVEEADRWLWRERVQDTEKEFEDMTVNQKAAYLKAKIKDIPWAEKLWWAWLLKIIEKNPNAWTAFVLWELAREISDIKEFSVLRWYLAQKTPDQRSDFENKLIEAWFIDTQAADKRGNPAQWDAWNSIFKWANTNQWINAIAWSPTDWDPIERDRKIEEIKQWFKSDQASKVANESWQRFLKSPEIKDIKENDPEKYKVLRKQMLLRIKQKYTNL